MPFKYKRKTDRGKIDPQKFLEVAKLVLDREISLCSASSTFDLPKTTLGRYVARLKNDVTMCPSYQNSMIFSINEEMALCEYVIKSSKMHYGLNTTCVKQLAFSYATALGKNIPKNWSDNKAASSDWLRGFLGRNHNILSIRTPEATSLSRSTSFNKHNISMFFENLKICYQKRKFEAHRIFNVDETGVTTVQKPKKVVTQKGLKQVGQVTSAERGTLITVCFAVNAIGHVIPPFFIFPRVNYKDYMLKNAPIGSTGVAHPSGWMNENLFINFFDHFLKFTKPDENDPILLIMDNHFSHISINLINKARDNHVTLLTLPPHCSNRMQPLDISVFGPFKSYYNTAADGWLLNHPGKTITIYDIPELVAEAVPKGFTISNITSGFAKSGIYPFNPEVFNEEDFLCSSVTDRPTPPPLIATSPASTSKSYELQPEITPEAIRPFPAALPRKTSNRRKGSTKILTSTPEKNLIEQQQQRQQNNKATRRPPAKKNKMVKKKLFMNNKTAEPAKMTSENEKEKADEEMGTNAEVHVPLTFLSLHAIFVKIIFTNRVLTTMRMGMVMKQ